MVDLVNGATGKLGNGVYYSDLFGEALRVQFTGCIQLRLAEGEANTYLREGMPVQAIGSALTTDRLGDLLVEDGTLTAEQVASVCDKQGEGRGKARLGTLLVRYANVNATKIEDVIRMQTARRVALLFSVTDATYVVEQRAIPEVLDTAQEVDGPPLLLYSLKHQASDQELRDQSDALLGHAVALQIAVKVLEQFQPSEDDRSLVAYLDRPRKLQHLELVAKSRRECRALLKTLLLFRFLGLQPAKAGIPIKEVSKVQAPTTQVVARRGSSTTSSSDTANAQAEAQAAAEQRAQTPPKPRAAPRKPDTPAIKELRALYERLHELDYYQLLGVKDGLDDPAELRTAFTTMAKKFHPDAIGSDPTDEVADLARGVAAALNEAYNTLSDVDRRKSYLLSRSQGNSTSGLTDEQLTARANAAKVKYEMALVFMKKRDFKKARETLRFAIDLAPKTGLYKGALAWAMFTDPQLDRKEAIDKGLILLEEAATLAPREPDVRYWQGRFFKELGDEDEAAEFFRKALRVDPKHSESERELRVIEMRKKKERPQGRSVSSTFARFFKKG